MATSVDLNLVLSGLALLLAGAQSIRARNARKAEKEARKKLLNQMSADEFGGIARDAATLTIFIRSGDWRRSTEISTMLRGSISQAAGAWNRLLSEDEKVKLEGAAEQSRLLVQAIPLENHQQNEAQDVKLMTDRTILIMDVANEIGGRLKYTDDSEGSDVR